MNKAPQEKTRRLGRGLEALISLTAPSASSGEQPPLRQIPIAQIRPNPYQPRKEFPEAELAELEASLRESGLLQPITVRPTTEGRGYELVAGERRLRAATRLGWTEIPAIVKEVDDRALLTFALVENLQRADLNPVEEAEGYHRLLNEFDLTQQQVADIIGKDRSTVANLIRILALPATVRRMLQEGQITLGHARALLALGQQHAIVELAQEVVARQLTVRDVERRAREAGARRKPNYERPPRDQSHDPQVRRLTDELRRYLQTDVHLTVTDGQRGEIRIQFYSPDDLERLMDLIINTGPGR